MKKQLFRIFITTFCLLSTWSTHAAVYDFEINGIYYKFNGYGNVAVAPNNSNVGGSYSGNVIIPSSVTYEGPEDYNGKTYSVNAIYDMAFYNCPELTSVTLPNTILSINNYAFEGCSGLSEIILPPNLESLGECPFIDCNNLTTVFCLPKNAPNWVKEDWDNTFDNVTEFYVVDDFYYKNDDPWKKLPLKNLYTITITPSPVNGKIEISGARKIDQYYKEGDNITLTAIPNAGYLFQQWSDETTENPCSFTIQSNIEISAEFIVDESAIKEIENSDIKVYTSNRTLFIENAPAGEQIAIYNLLGQTIKTAQVHEGSNGFTLSSGVYLVKYGNKIVKVQL